MAPILAFDCLVLRPSLDPRCFVARSPTDWARIHVELGPVAVPLGPSAPSLPVRPCSFQADVAVLVVLPMGIHLAKMDASMVTEEGVDVLTITRTFAPQPPTEPLGLAYLSQAALVVLPQRQQQLAVVLKTLRFADVEESTLAVFDSRH